MPVAIADFVVSFSRCQHDYSRKHAANSDYGARRSRATPIDIFTANFCRAVYQYRRMNRDE